MKRKTLLFSLFAGMSYLALTGYAGGPANGGLGNRTTTGCGGGGCHANNTAATTVALFIAEQASPTVPVTKYVPGRTYVVNMGGSNSSQLAKFGFQTACVKASATNTQAGTWSTGSTTGIAIRSAGGLSVVEHTSARSPLSPGIYGVQFNWTAPAAGTGTVRFTAALNAVNGDNNSSGDAPNIGTFDIQEVPVSVASVTRELNIRTYPNPATSDLHLNVAGAEAGSYQVAVFNLAGQQMMHRNLEVTAGTRDISLNVRDWATGTYQLLLSKDGASQTLTFVKQ